jgi:hypothetical protein
MHVDFPRVARTRAEARGTTRAAAVPLSRLLLCLVFQLAGAAGFRGGAAGHAGSLRRNGASHLRSSSGAGLEGPNLPELEGVNLPVCDCTCCKVYERRLDETHESTGALLKCAMSEGGLTSEVIKRVPSGNPGELVAAVLNCPGLDGPEHSGRCTVDSGQPAEVAPNVLASTGPAGTDYNRFCFFQCRPTSFVIGLPCTALEGAGANESMTNHLNGRDPGLHPESAGAPPLDQQNWTQDDGMFLLPTTLPPLTTTPGLHDDLLEGYNSAMQGQTGAVAKRFAANAGKVADRVLREAKAAARHRADVNEAAPAPAPALSLAASGPGGRWQAPTLAQLRAAPLSTLRSLVEQRFAEMLDENIGQFSWLLDNM